MLARHRITYARLFYTAIGLIAVKLALWIGGKHWTQLELGAFDVLSRIAEIEGARAVATVAKYNAIKRAYFIHKYGR